jgi:hypothetical protein
MPPVYVEILIGLAVLAALAGAASLLLLPPYLSRPLSSNWPAVDTQPGGGPRRYLYKYQIHPFDDWRYFEIVAFDRVTAELMASDHFATLLEGRQTVYDRLYRCYPEDTR